MIIYSKKTYLLIALSIWIFSSCSKEDFNWDLSQGPSTPKLEIQENNLKEVLCKISVGSGPTDATQGICWSTSELPTIEDEVLFGKPGERDVRLRIPWTNSNYYTVRAFSKNNIGILYSSPQKIIWNGKSIEHPMLNLSSATNTSFTSIEAKGKVENNNGLELLETGFCISIDNTPTIENSIQILKTNLINQEASIQFNNLTSNTQYYVKFYCKSMKGLTYSQVYSIKSPKEYSIGDIGPAGGTIIYQKPNYSNLWNFIEVASQDISGTYAWGNSSNQTNIIEKSLEKGLENTASMLSFFGKSGTYSALTADNWIYNSFSDWYLPTIQELILIRKTILNNQNHNLADNMYWSSTEDSNFPDLAWVVRMTPTSELYFTQAKKSLVRVRAIRRF